MGAVSVFSEVEKEGVWVVAGPVGGALTEGNGSPLYVYGPGLVGSALGTELDEAMLVE